MIVKNPVRNAGLYQARRFRGKRIWTLLAICLLVVAFWVLRNPNEGREAIEPLEAQFSISWPTNCIVVHGATRTSGRAVVRVGRLELDNHTYQRWVEANSMRLPQDALAGIPDPWLTNAYSWWQPSSASSETAVCFMTRAEDPLRYLWVKAIPNTNRVVMYLWSYSTAHD